MAERAAVRVPATSANLGPGFDSLALCLDLADVVVAETAPSGAEVSIAGEGAGALATGEDNLVVVAMRAAYDGWGLAQPGLRLRCRNVIPQGVGLGSSSAAIVSGLLLAARLADRPADPAELLTLATALEGHPDNGAGCLLGGLVVSWWDASGAVRAERIALDPRVRAVALLPARALPTEVSRQALPASVPLETAAADAARVALLVTALGGRPDLLLAGTEDLLHQEARRSMMPESLALIDDLRGDGVPAVLSGAGPAVLCLVADAATEQRALAAGPQWRPLALHIGAEGARLVEPAAAEPASGNAAGR